MSLSFLHIVTHFLIALSHIVAASDSTQSEDHASIVSSIVDSNALRRSQLRFVVTVEWSLLQLSMLLLAMISAVWMSWILSVFKYNIIQKWTVIIFCLINVLFWKIGFVVWIAFVGLLIALCVVTNLLYYCKSTRQATQSTVSVNNALLCNHYPRKMTHHQKNAYLTALIMFICVVISFAVVLCVWSVPEYKIYSRISQQAETEYQPQIVAKALAAIYMFDGFARRLHLASLFKWSSQCCSTKFNRQLKSEEKNVAIKISIIDKYAINMQEFELSNYMDYDTVNEWFARKIRPSARPIEQKDDVNVIVSPADSRVIVIPSVLQDSKLWFKNDQFTVRELLSPGVLDEQYLALEGGSALIARLSLQDYHRYHSPVSGTVVTQIDVDGDLFSVSADAVRSGNAALYNKRTVTIIEQSDMSIVGFVAIGATCVGSVVSIVRTGAQVKKGDELGYFQFGGSMVVTLFESGDMKFSPDLLLNSNESVETLVRMGMEIGNFNA